ncbi:flagellar assembly protein FliW [Clostridium sp. 'White wine YQ']|uniref:flagellar assembly protein FliW n=1 Tax=Clostridium sp. 'White wine YQ' TaxID=3027474 RepID=UPI0023667A2E|nr:flagellar assembly protein FliW [Clostridium sp. 'White wine YQ']MDD7794631.1 flagellar assembly protein FliW [Clostridium sp. 'White wine YQ']
MEIVTRFHGTFNYDEKDIINFPNGIMGFEDLKKFIIVQSKENEAFSIFQSLENSEVGLVVVSPFDVKKDYEIELNEEVIKSLSIENPEEVVLYNTVTLNSDVYKITVNLKAPIIININKKVGKQVIIDKEDFKIKHPLIKR